MERIQDILKTALNRCTIKFRDVQILMKDFETSKNPDNAKRIS